MTATPRFFADPAALIQGVCTWAPDAPGEKAIVDFDNGESVWATVPLGVDLTSGDTVAATWVGQGVGRQLRIAAVISHAPTLPTDPPQGA